MPDPGAPISGRLVALLAAAVGAVALIGLMTGTAPGTYQAKRPSPRERPQSGSVPPARSHAELERRPWGSSPAQSGWLESRRIAKQAEPPEPAEAPPVEDALRERAQRRAFDGAPPVVPHPVRAGGAACGFAKRPTPPRTL